MYQRICYAKEKASAYVCSVIVASVEHIGGVASVRTRQSRAPGRSKDTRLASPVTALTYGLALVEK